MEDILPESVLESLREHYYAGVTAAEIGYVHNAADEDAVTGALGQELFTKGIRFIEDNGRVYSWRAFHYKVGGRGEGAPEGWLGADGIFQLESLSAEGTVLRRKALLFQAKKEWRGTNKRLLDQVEKMAHYSLRPLLLTTAALGLRPLAGLMSSRHGEIGEHYNRGAK